MATKSKDATTLDRDQAKALYEHIRAIESLEEDKADIQADITERKTLVCETLPVQKDVLNFVLKRRKHSKGIVHNFDTMLELVEQAIAEVEEEHAGDVRDRIAQASQNARRVEAADEDDEELEDEPEETDDDPDGNALLVDANDPY